MSDETIRRAFRDLLRECKLADVNFFDWLHLHGVINRCDHTRAHDLGPDAVAGHRWALTARTFNRFGGTDPCGCYYRLEARRVDFEQDPPERDPLVDPKPGDVFQKGLYQRRVVAATAVGISFVYQRTNPEVVLREVWNEWLRSDGGVTVHRRGVHE